MRILVVNVNTTASMTEAIAASARAVAGPSTEIVPLTPAIGADSVEGNFESYLAAVAVMDAVTRYPEPRRASASTAGRGSRSCSRYRSSTSPRRPVMWHACWDIGTRSSPRSTVRCR